MKAIAVGAALAAICKPSVAAKAAPTTLRAGTLFVIISLQLEFRQEPAGQ